MFTAAKKRERYAFDRLAEAAERHRTARRDLKEHAAKLFRRAALLYATAVLDEASGGEK